MAYMKLEDVAVHYLIPELKSAGLLSTVRAVNLGGKLQKLHGRSGVTALENINLELKDGDRLALMGHNGAGKTTLLRVLASILPPTEGRVRIEGQISALMTIRLGMSGTMSGYDNIRSRARYMGVPEKQIDAQFGQIAEFTELGDYLHLPINSYSSGMRVRLAFAIATAFYPDILILDEWLSAGDERFKNKASERMHSLIENTGIVAFASHNIGMLKNICNKAIVLKKGQIVFQGSVEEAAAILSDS